MKIIRTMSLLVMVIVISGVLFNGCMCRDKNRYYNDTKKFSLIFSSGWEQVKPLMGADLAIVPPGTGTMGEYPTLFTVVVRDINNPQPLADYMLENIEMIKSVLSGFELMDSGEEKINGEKCGMIHFSYIQGTKSLKMEVFQYIILEKKKQISLTYTSPSPDFSRFMNDAKKMVMSFRLED